MFFPNFAALGVKVPLNPNWLGGFLMSLNTFLYYEHEYIYPCRVKRIIDGDTLVLIVDLGFKIEAEIVLRLNGFDAPEPRGDTTKEGIKFKNKAADYFVVNSGPFFVESHCKGKFGRWIGDVFCNTEPDDSGRCAKATLTQHQRIEWKSNGS